MNRVQPHVCGPAAFCSDGGHSLRLETLYFSNQQTGCPDLAIAAETADLKGFDPPVPIYRIAVCGAAAMSGLSSGFPGTIAGPDSPPFVMPLRLSTYNSAFSSFASVLWQS